MTFISDRDIPAIKPSVKRYFPQIFAAFSASLFAVSDGMSYGWTSPMVPYLISDKSHIKTNIHEAEWLETAFLYGSLFGLPLTLYSVDRFGRKPSLIMAIITIFIAWCLIGLGNSMVYLFIARFMAGLSSDMAYVACPMYIAEISDRKIRGLLGGVVVVLDHVGSLMVYGLGSFTPVYSTPIVGAAIVLTELLLLYFIPESPYYLMAKAKELKARNALKFFKPYKNIEEEFENIMRTLDKQKTNNGNIKDIFRIKSNRKAFTIIIIINLLPQLLGYLVMLMNLHIILDSAGSIYMDSSQAGILYGCVMFIATILCSISVDKFGRKILLCLSAGVSGLCMLALALYFHLKSLKYNVMLVSWIPIASAMTFGLFFKIGIGIVPVILTAEIAPMSHKSIGVTLGDGLMVVGGLVAIQIYQFITKLSGLYLPFYIYSSWAVVLIVFTHLCVPETKGISLDDIQKKLNGEKIERRKSNVGILN